MVTIARCAVIGGAESWVEIAEFGRTKADWFAAFLDLPNGIPSHDPFGRVFAQLDAAPFAACFADWMQAVTAVLPTQVIALDGKTLRRSHDRGAGKAALHLVSAWASANQLVLAQVAVDDQSNAITAFPQVPRRLALTGCLVTIEARGCQTAIAEHVLEQEADDVLALKENQEDRYDAVRDSFTLARASGFAECAPDSWSYARRGRSAKGMGAWSGASTGGIGGIGGPGSAGLADRAGGRLARPTRHWLGRGTAPLPRWPDHP